MRKTIFAVKFLPLFLLLMSAGPQVGAQVNLLFNTQMSGRDMRGLSMVQLINRSTVQYTGNLEVEVRELSHNGLVVKIVVTQVSSSPGNSMVPAARFMAATISYAATAEGNYVRQTGMMPEGDLEYCFRFTASAKDSPLEIFENCFTGINIISSPMQLVAPDNGRQSCEKRPRFSWQPPLPLAPGTVYTLKLVEVGAGQSPAEAVLVNTPLIFQMNIRDFMLPFPAGVADLKENIAYAWQVTANQGGRQLLSEVWEFRVQCNQDEVLPGSYRELTEKDDGGFLSTGSSLRFALYNPYTGGRLQYKISNLSSPEKALKKLPVVDLQSGQNNVLVDLNKIPGMQEDDEYLLTVTLPDGKKVSVRFKYDNGNE